MLHVYVKTHVFFCIFFSKNTLMSKGRHFTFLDNRHSLVLKCFIQGRISGLLYLREREAFWNQNREETTKWIPLKHEHASTSKQVLLWLSIQGGRGRGKEISSKYPIVKSRRPQLPCPSVNLPNAFFFSPFSNPIFHHLITWIWLITWSHQPELISQLN